MKEIWQRLIFGTQKPRVVTIIGGGGKTSLMYYLLRMLKSIGQIGIGTTTTKLSSEQRPGNVFVKIKSTAAGHEAINGAAAIKDTLTLVMGEDPMNIEKMVGIPREWVDELSRLNKDVLFLVEGDGAAGKSLKGHLAHEPVVPQNSCLVAVMVGIDSIGAKLTSQNVHRPERICEMTGAKLESKVTGNLITQLLFHPQGYLHQCPKESQIVFFINKVESVIGHHQAKELADGILAMKHPQVIGVILGSIRKEEGLWFQA